MTAKKIVGYRAHIEFAIASKEENVQYCSKEGNVIIRKEDDQGIFDERDAHYWALLEAAKTMTRIDFARCYPIDYVVRHSVCEKLIASCQTCQEPWGGNLQHKNFWVAGIAGTGKSKWASSILPAWRQYRKNTNKWWDGYASETHKAVIIEDLGPETAKCLVTHLKVWADRYGFTGEIKGGSMVVWPGNFYFIVTSNYPIDMCFPMDEDDETIQRRFTEWWIDKPNDIRFNTRPCVLEEEEQQVAE
jgi:hypothetical protein